MSQPSLLIYGRDPLLLQTRRWVLESTGFEVQATIEAADADRILNAQPLAVLILCHTLSFEECSRILAVARALQPEMKNLILTTSGSGCAASGQDLVLREFAGAKVLISTVQGAISGPFIASDSPE